MGELSNSIKDLSNSIIELSNLIRQLSIYVCTIGECIPLEFRWRALKLNYRAI